jgi:hypothetical protein
LPDGSTDWLRASEEDLFVGKRARTLASVLFARRLIESLPAQLENPAQVIASSEEVRRAFSIGLREIRKVGLASRLLELNVCGAVPPYRDLLVGKLAALAACSAEVCDEYGARYAGRPSEIASRLAGRPVVRNGEVCVIATTSLYGVAASQYNRLRVALGERGAAAQTLRWEDLELTEGYGTAHLTEETVRTLRELSVAHRGGRNVNNVFGEGASPRLRQVREALEDLGVDPDGILRHETPRRVYAVELFDGARECLNLNKPANSRPPGFDALSEAWTNRWLAARVLRTDVIERVRQQGRVSLKRELRPEPPTSPQQPASRTVVPKPKGEAANAEERSGMPANTQLIAGLYRAASACADHHDAATVRLLHIESSVDGFLRERAKVGGLIFVTGNPGDGKTHLLRRLEPELRAEGMAIALDCNEVGDRDLLRQIDQAHGTEGGGLALAINEGVLVNLLKVGRERPWVAAVRQQLLQPTVVGSAVEPLESRVRVLDLSLRNNLAAASVSASLDALARLAGPCEGCPGGCALQRNMRRLASPEVRKRLQALLDLVARTEFHATMRDLQGFLSFLLFGGKTCDDFKEGGDGGWYWENAFESGDGPLFEAVRRFAPENHPTPLLDDVLWRGSTKPDDWFLQHSRKRSAEESLEERFASFKSEKRRALFEHREGLTILGSAMSPLEKTMAEVREGGRRGTSIVVRQLNRFFDRDETTSELLHLWTTHRYDSRPSRFAASFASVPVAELEVLVPRLHPEIASAFQDYHPGHVFLGVRGGSPAQALRIDPALLAALLGAEAGLPSTFRRGEPEARITAFMDRLARQRTPEENFCTVRLVDMDTGENMQVEIDLRERSFKGV